MYSCGITTGTVHQVNRALEMIKRKFPMKRFPGIDYSRCLPDVPVLPADIMQVTLSVVSMQYTYICVQQARPEVFCATYSMYTCIAVDFFTNLALAFALCLHN